MSRYLKAAFGLIFDRAGWKLLSLAVAIVIWAMVASEPELSTFVSTQVEYKNLPPDLEISSNPVTTVMLELRGPSGELQGLGGEGVHPQIILDLTSARPGQYTYAIDHNSVKLPRGVHLVGELPAQVHFDFETRGERTVPVTVRFTGEGHNGYVVASKEVSPSTEKIEGAKSHVAADSEVVTDPVDVSDVVGPTTFRVAAYATDPFVHIKSSPQVTVTVTMKKR